MDLGRLRRIRPHYLIALLVFLRAACSASICQAADPLAIVVVLVPRRAVLDDRFSLASAIAAQVADLPVQILLEAPPSESDDPDPIGAVNQHHALAAFWFELDQGHLLLYAYDARAGAAHRRKLSNASEQAQIEEAAIIVRNTTSARLEGGPLRLGDESVSEPASITSRKPIELERDEHHPPRGPTRTDLKVAYEASMLSSSLLQHGLSLSGHAKFGLHLDAGLGVVAWLPASFSAEGTMLQLQRATARMEAGSRWRLGPTTVRLSCGFFVERINRSTASVSYNLAPTEDSARATLGPFLNVEVGTSITDALQLTGGLGIDVPLRNWSYVVGSSTDPVLELWPVRPGIQMGARFDL